MARRSGPEGVGGWIRRRASKSGDKPALVFRDREISYRDLADRIDMLASALRDRGVRPGDRAAYLGNNHPAFIEALFATTLLGAVFVPLNTRLAIPELAYILADSGPRVLLCADSLESLAAGAIADLPIQRIVIAYGEPVGDFPHAEELETALEAAPQLGQVPRTRLDDKAAIIYTSGTTGRPKGVVLTHGNLTWNAINVLVDYDVVSDDRALMISPLFHVASLGMGCLPMLLKGATVLLQERFEPGEALDAIDRLRATSLSGVPTTFQLMAEHPAWAKTDLASLRMMTCGGSAVPVHVREAYEMRGLHFSSGYGMTEAAPGVTSLAPRHAVERAGSSGLPHFFTDVRLRSKTGADVLAGEPGEIEVRGPNVFTGYWSNMEATEAAFTPDGWLRTGDVGVLDDNGFITIVDRVEDMVISGGENVYPVEVEQAIALLDGVTGVAVIGIPDDRWGEVPHAVLTIAPGRRLEPDELVAFLSARLARYKVPKTFEVIDELPRTASGKIQKNVLRQRHAANFRVDQG